MRKPFAANTLICSADTCPRFYALATMLGTSYTSVSYQTRGATPNQNSKSATTPKTLSDMNISSKNQNNTNAHNLSVVAINNRNMTKLNNHSNDNLDKNLELIELSRITKKESCECQCRYKYRYSHTHEEIECELHKKGDVYGKESIIRKRVNDEYGGSRRAANLKFKCVRDAQEWTEALRRTMGVRMHAVVVMWLLFAMVATCAAAPARTHLRPTRSTTESVRSYLQTFGYLKRGVPEIGNLLHGDADSTYDADLKAAITTLQEFGGIPVTGEVDDATMQLMKKKRCGRPDRETGDNEHGKRKKRFVVQGEKWKNTSLTWSMSSVSRPSNLDMHLTRSVLARALDVWEQESRLTFTEINSDTADIVVSFAKRNHGDMYPFDGRGSILAHAFFPGSGRGGDAHFDDDELWLLQPKNDDEEGTSLFAVAAHEFGHSLGLSHSSEKGALMFPWYQGIQPNFILPEDDRNGIQEMYGPKEKRTWARIPHYPSIGTPPPTTTTTTTTTTRPYIHHHNRHQHNYTPYPRTPGKYPTYYPERRYYPQVPPNPERPQYPDRRYYNTSEGYPRRPDPHYPRPTETTTHPTTTRPRYPTARPEYPRYKHVYPNHRNQPNYPRQDYPKRKPYYPERTTARPTPPSDIPDTCDTSYDAVTLIRGELFIFKNRYHWRIGDEGRYKGYPMEITRMWSDLPRELTHVDAVYERQDKKIVIFIGKLLYLFEARELIRGYPRPIQYLGLPDYVEKLDAAMVWGHNEKTYFYSGDRYWKYDEEVGRVEPDYPRDMSMWKGVGYNIDSVFQWKDGKTYFFKGKGFWKFNDLKMQVEQEAQLSSASFWMACGERAGRRERLMTLPAPGSTLRSLSPAAASSTRINKLLLYLTTIALLVKSYTRYC